ncbi:putative FAD-binding oxidoreductase [Xylariaceae sp. FL0662B]|nr:putative FAD-binding oxidoreductase [Xylariaceae sp. FL0662B]
MAMHSPDATVPRPTTTQRGLASSFTFTPWFAMSAAALLAVLFGLLYRIIPSGSNGAAHVDRATADQLGSSSIVLPSSTAEYTEFEQIPFAIRSGGHSPNPFDSDIDTGVLISLDKFDEISYDAGTGLVSLGPGARWHAVYKELDKYNRTTVGGRVVDVGIGDLILGCGSSYWSDSYGLVCDNMASYEAKTYPIYESWGDPHANMVINLIPINGTLLLTLVYLKPVERPEAYAPFYALTPVFEQTGFMTLHQLMALFPATTLPRWTWYLGTLYATAPETATIGALQAGTLVAATWWAITVGWWNAEDDAAAYAAGASFAEKVHALAAAADAGLEFIFMNDANIDQPVITSYGEANVRRLRAAQEAYDPDLVFQKFVPGGQKIPEAIIRKKDRSKTYGHKFSGCAV